MQCMSNYLSYDFAASHIMCFWTCYTFYVIIHERKKCWRSLASLWQRKSKKKDRRGCFKITRVFSQASIPPTNCHYNVCSNHGLVQMTNWGHCEVTITVVRCHHQLDLFSLVPSCLSVIWCSSSARSVVLSSTGTSLTFTTRTCILHPCMFQTMYEEKSPPSWL